MAPSASHDRPLGCRLTCSRQTPQRPAAIAMKHCDFRPAGGRLGCSRQGSRAMNPLPRIGRPPFCFRASTQLHTPERRPTCLYCGTWRSPPRSGARDIILCGRHSNCQSQRPLDRRAAGCPAELPQREVGRPSCCRQRAYDAMCADYVSLLCPRARHGPIKRELEQPGEPGRCFFLGRPIVGQLAFASHAPPPCRGAPVEGGGGRSESGSPSVSQSVARRDYRQLSFTSPLELCCALRWQWGPEAGIGAAIAAYDSQASLPKVSPGRFLAGRPVNPNARSTRPRGS